MKVGHKLIKKRRLKKPLLIPEVKIQSLEHYIQLVCDETMMGHNLSKIAPKLFSSLTLFRGQDCDEPLLPKIARSEYLSSDIEKKEQRIYSEFRRRAHLFTDIDLNNKLNLIALAQHHGLPTRLLDWTENPLTALWFALEKQSMACENRIIWRLSVKEDELIEDPLTDPFALTKTTVFKPAHVTKRIAVQSGWFTIHKYGQTFVSLNTNTIFKNRLRRFLIPNSIRTDTLLKLDKLGINAFTLFPDLDGLSNYLKWNNSNGEKQGVTLKKW